jgi:hypothetical protein
MSFHSGNVRIKDARWYRRQADHAREAIAIAERQATPEELANAAAILAIAPDARQKELGT